MPNLTDLEFCWLSSNDRVRFRYVQPGFQEELPNDNLPKVVFDRRLTLDQLAGWCAEHQNLNVHRTLQLYAQASGACATLEGPILLDIDNEREDLVSAYLCTREALNCLKQSLDIKLTSDCRVFFSGRKGFHIELRPSAVRPELLGPATRSGRPKLHVKLTQYVSGALGHPTTNVGSLDQKGTILDPEHGCKRINGSINAWSCDGKLTRRGCIAVARDLIVAGEPDALMGTLTRQSESIRPKGYSRAQGIDGGRGHE